MNGERPGVHSVGIRSLGRYQIRGEIGRGTMGVVYRGHDPVIDRPVALKTVLVPEPLSPSQRATFLERFFLEARIAGRLLHPNIVVTYDAATDEDTGIPFIAMELIDGEPLSRHLEDRGRIPWKDALDLVVPLGQALGYAHADGIVHRDIKPANVLLTPRGIPKIADFGIAKLPTAHFTATGVVVGTPYFMSPEQLRGETLDARSDLFSLGSLLYNLLTGRPPFTGSELAVIASQVLYKNPPSPSEVVAEVPGELDGVLARALAKAVDDRYRSAAELVDDLLAVRQGMNPRRALSLGEKTQARDAVVAPRPLSEEAPGVKAEAAPPKGSPGHVMRKLRASALGRTPALAALLMAAAGLAALYFRSEIIEEKLFWEARKAAEQGRFQQSEAKLEELVARNSEFSGAAELLSQVSRELLQPSLPLTFSARHNHRLGSCTGRLTLHDWGIEYSSSKHPPWQWRAPKVRAIERRDPRSLALETNEQDMLGLLTKKNYVFFLLDGTLEDEPWKRYQRLFESTR